jgi:hypothetical protein
MAPFRAPSSAAPVSSNKETRLYMPAFTLVRISGLFGEDDSIGISILGSGETKWVLKKVKKLAAER